jgi:hypothetical protein
VADTKISALTDGTTAVATDRLPVARSPFGSGDNRYVTPAYIRTYLLALASDWSAASAASTPAARLSGAWFTGGDATTTKPHQLIEPSGATSANWSTAGTGLGINAPSGFTGNLLDCQLNGAARFRITGAGVALSADGSNTAPAYGFSSVAMGWYRSSTVTVFAAASADIWWTGASAITMRSNGTYNFSSGTTAGSAIDVTLSREAAGILGNTGSLRVLNATAIPAGGTAGAGYKFSSTANFGVFFGSGAPTLAAAKGSLYLRSDGSGTGDRAYINTDGATAWTALTTAA